MRFAQQCRPDAAVLQPGKHRQRSDAQHGRGTPVLRDDLQPGQQIVVDTGNVAGFTAGVQMEIRQVPGMKNKLLGGEGLFNTVLTGPGRIWLQTMPISGVAAALLPYIPTGNN